MFGGFPNTRKNSFNSPGHIQAKITLFNHTSGKWREGGGVTKILGFEKAGEGGRGGSFEKLKMLLEEIRGYFSENL